MFIDLPMVVPSSSPTADAGSAQERSSPRAGPNRVLSDEDIPTELYNKMISLLSTQDFITCLRVSRFIHFITCPILYPTIYSTLEIDLNAPSSPIRNCGVPLTINPAPSPPLDTLVETSVNRSGIRTSTRISISKEPLPNRFEYLTHLTIPSHHHSLCRDLTSLVSPKLDTLRIRPSGMRTSLQICSSGTAGCPCIRDLRPRRLIVGGLHTDLTGPSHTLWGPLYRASCPLPSLSELVVLVGMFSGETGYSTLQGLQCLPKTVEKFTFVMSHHEEAWAEVDEVGYEGLAEALGGTRDDSEVEENMAAAATGDAGIIEVVGAELSDLFVTQTEGPDMDVKAYLRSELRFYLLKRGWDVSAAEERAARIVFVDTQTFARREAWYRAVQGESREPLREALRSLAQTAKQALEA